VRDEPMMSVPEPSNVPGGAQRVICFVRSVPANLLLHNLFISMLAYDFKSNFGAFLQGHEQSPERGLQELLGFPQSSHSRVFATW
jgi:hypothetical protein